MIKWRIYYGDGSVYDDSYGKPQFAPKVNVQCVVVNHEASRAYDAELDVLDVGRLVLHDWEYYIHHKTMGWIGLKNTVDLLDHVLHDVANIDVVLKARTLATDEFRKIYKRAWNDPDFPPKSAIEKREAEQHFGDPS